MSGNETDLKPNLEYFSDCVSISSETFSKYESAEESDVEFHDAEDSEETRKTIPRSFQEEWVVAFSNKMNMILSSQAEELVTNFSNYEDDNSFSNESSDENVNESTIEVQILNNNSTDTPKICIDITNQVEYNFNDNKQELYVEIHKCVSNEGEEEVETVINKEDQDIENLHYNPGRNNSLQNIDVSITDIILSNGISDSTEYQINNKLEFEQYQHKENEYNLDISCEDSTKNNSINKGKFYLEQMSPKIENYLVWSNNTENKNKSIEAEVCKPVSLENNIESISVVEENETCCNSFINFCCRCF